MTMAAEIDTRFPRFKVMDTHFEGYAFRSRLEARWAFFFGSSGLIWDYEPTAFETSHGPLTPNFWLPEYQTWVSVQPPRFEIENSPAWLAGRELADAQKTSFMLVVGDPFDVFNSITSDVRSKERSRFYRIRDSGVATGAGDLCREMNRDTLRDYSSMQCAAYLARNERFE